MVAVSALSSDAAAQTPRPAPSPSAPRTVEGVTFGPDASLLSLTPEQQRVAYRNLRLLAPHNLVARGQAVSPLPQAPIDLKGFTYNYQNRKRSLAAFLAETRVAGFLVIKDGHVVAEKYAHGRPGECVGLVLNRQVRALAPVRGGAPGRKYLEP